MQSDLDKVSNAKIEVVSISYDDVETLKTFADQKMLGFTLLSDPDSSVIKAYGVLNESARGRQEGIPHPITVLIGVDGKVKAKLPGTVRVRHATQALIDAAQR